MITFDIEGKVAVVTGGASGLGKAIAKGLAEAGATVVIADLNNELAMETAKELIDEGRKASAFKVDVTDSSSMFSLIDSVVEENGTLDIMVNNAGITLKKPIIEMTDKEIDAILNINLKGTINGCRAALRHMVEKNDGRVINMSSISAKAGEPNDSLYAASKAGVIALTSSLSREVAQNNININAVCPGIVRTPMLESVIDGLTGGGDKTANDQAFMEICKKMIPMQRPQELDDIANMVVMLSSDMGKNITGQSINVDGGMIVG